MQLQTPIWQRMVVFDHFWQTRFCTYNLLDLEKFHTFHPKYMYFQNVGLSLVSLGLTSLIAPQLPNYMYFEIRSFTSTCTLKVL